MTSSIRQSNQPSRDLTKNTKMRNKKSNPKEEEEVVREVEEEVEDKAEEVTTIRKIEISKSKVAFILVDSS